jgi:hypothetical protein
LHQKPCDSVNSSPLRDAAVMRQAPAVLVPPGRTATQPAAVRAGT